MAKLNNKTKKIIIGLLAVGLVAVTACKMSNSSSCSNSENKN